MAGGGGGGRDSGGRVYWQRIVLEGGVLVDADSVIASMNTEL